ncbi:DUF6314 family protein [Marivita sp. S0852]|uniref:DUF6314 family protein n=1 Tax=Marivita sp. S0852 TaxID=3373893 RepID=UPI0039829E7C
MNKRPALSAFLGTWLVHRSIHNHRSGRTGQFDGTAVFSPDTGGLAYVETGHLHLDGHPPFKAERRYFWRCEDHILYVDFDDRRPFHSLPPNTRNARHWCDPDMYDVTYDFSAWPVWHSTWDVSGPQKAYRMTTSYRRKTEN